MRGGYKLLNPDRQLAQRVILYLHKGINTSVLITSIQLFWGIKIKNNSNLRVVYRTSAQKKQTSLLLFD